MGFLDLFVEREKAPEKQDVKPVPQKVIPTSVAIREISPVSVSPIGGADFEAFKNQFTKILDDENKRNYPGNDYYEFVTMLRAMVAIPQDDVRYKAAFAGWAVGGNQTKQSLIDTAHIYLGLVDKEIKDFQTAYETQCTTQVGNSQQVIDQKRAQVATMSQQIAKLNEEILTMTQQNAIATQTLTRKHDAFMAAGQAQRQEILDEIEKINHFIN